MKVAVFDGLGKIHCTHIKQTILAICIFMLPSYGKTAELPGETEQENILPKTVVVEQEQATVVGLNEYQDPLEKFNRTMFGFNDVIYTYVAAPIGNVYEVLPVEVRNGVSRVFLNIREPLNMVNNLMQGHFRNAGSNVMRFVTNTTIGIAGLFDPAQSLMKIAPSPSGFNDTFTRYGFGSGPYIVLPLLGETDIRGGVGRVLDTTLHPVRLITDEPDTTYIIVFDNFQRVIPQIDNYIELRNQADDPYIYFRNQYLQAAERDKRVFDSEQGMKDE